MSCYSKNFEFFKGEDKRIEIQINTHNTKDDCTEPMGLDVPLAQASLVVQDLTFTSLLKLGDTGNKIQIEYVGGGNAGLEAVTLSGTPIHVGQGYHVYPKISVKIESGVSTATQIKAALEANSDVMKMLAVSVSGVASNPQVAAAIQSLTGGTGSSVEVELPTDQEANLFLDLTTTPPVVIENAPLSKIYIDLNSDQTSQMISGSAIIRVTKQGKLRVAIAQSGLKESMIPNC